MKITEVRVDDIAVYIKTSEGKVFSEKFEDYPRLRHATAAQRAVFEYNDMYIRWEELDEDLSIAGFMKKRAIGNELSRFFKLHPELNVSAIARRVGISQSMMAAYLCGIKKPSPGRENEIKNVIRQIGVELTRI